MPVAPMQPLTCSGPDELLHMGINRRDCSSVRGASYKKCNGHAGPFF